MNPKRKQLSVRRHAKVSHNKNGQIAVAYVPYWNDHGWGTVEERVSIACREMNLQSPVHMIESGSGALMLNRLY